MELVLDHALANSGYQLRGGHHLLFGTSPKYTNDRIGW